MLLRVIGRGSLNVNVKLYSYVWCSAVSALIMRRSKNNYFCYATLH